MRRSILFSLMLISGSILSAQTPAIDELVCKENTRTLKLVQSRSVNTGFHGFNIHYHRCLWKVNPFKNKYLIGQVKSVFTTTQNSDSLGFDLMAFMRVDSVLWHGNKTVFTRNGNKIMVGKPGKWQANTLDSLTFYYQGNPEYGNGFGYYNFDAHQTGPLLYTLSEPYGAAYWWPCKQTLNDKIDSIDIFMQIPPALKAGCNGTLVSNDSINDSTRIMHWKHRYPIATYLVSFAVSNYSEYTVQARFSDRPDSMPIVNYVFPQAMPDIINSMTSHLKVMRLFDSLVGHYPFDKEKYGHSQFTWGGGMEHQTMSSVVSFDFDLLAHELAHQWFGDKVTCGSWADLWLNEGFATYMNALCYRYLRPHSDWINRMQDVRNAATSQDDGSVFARDTVTINALFSGNLRYNKGAFVLHMLRVKVGDAAFFGALKKYLSQPGTAYGFARTPDLKSIMEKESGKILDTFFQRWFWGEGFPRLQINWEQKGTSMRVNIKQTPSHFSVPLFELDIPILFKGKTRDSLVYFHLRSLEKTFTLNLPFAADTAIFDPEVTVLAKASLGGVNLDKTKTGQFILGPNPVVDYLNIYTFNNIVTEVEIYSVTGQKVYATKTDFSHSLGEIINLDLREFSSGTYITRIRTKNSLNSYKFTKQ